MPSEFTQTHLAALKDKHQSHLSPLAVIAHVDLDAFYAQCEQVRLGRSKTDPVVCRQWNGLIAVSYAARQYGVTRHEPAMAARLKCPDIIFAHVATFLKGDTKWAYHENPRKETHKVSLDPYRRESRKIFSIFKEHCRVVEKASIDETYLDLGDVVYKRLLELFPELREDKLSPGAPLPEPPTLAQLWEKGVEWMGSIYGSYADESESRQIGDAVGTELYDFMNTPKKETKVPDPAIKQQTPESTNPGSEANTAKISSSSSPPSRLTDLSRETILAQNPALEIQDWDDVCLLLGSVQIRDIRQHVLSSLQYTCSAGVARNRVLAKLGSSRHKPAKQVIIRRQAVMQFMAKFELTDVGGLGGKLGDSIVKKLGLPEHGSIRHLQEQITAAGGGGGKAALLKRLDDPALAKRVIAIVEGNDALPVGHGDITTKSMMATKNFTYAPVPTATDARAWLRVFAAELESRVLELSESTTHITLYPKTIMLTHKLAGAGAGPIGSQNKQVPFPSQVTPARLGETLYELGCALLAMFEQPEGTGKAYPCALLALGVSNFVDNSALLTKNRTLTSFFKPVPKKTSETGKSVLYTCPECQAKLEPHKRSEHADFHFAQRLATTYSSSLGSISSTAGPGRVTKKKPTTVTKQKKKKKAVIDKTQTRLNF
ncbi:hypothetical protein D0Z00_004048 [Geotrichum galactomycetum]|uniref:Uncharacterized protein n=1 Tax=Geotrichum galactomycetum TaxID=27317 RepID=A0ACB6UZG5_9ASCO|nr:hypothetical protein D0Z00_004048 [Geotrichum candidum]